MQSYRSEFGGIPAVLAVVGTLGRSDLINISSATFLCNSESAVFSTSRPLADSIFHRLESDQGLVITIKELQENWYQDIEIMYEWFKGHVDDLHRELNLSERLNVIPYENCD
jgi:hypothetical protein